MEIEGKVVKVRPLDSVISDPDLGDMTLEDVFKYYAQAAVDNVKFRLLNRWGYSQDNLFKKLFYNQDGTDLTDVQYEVLKRTYLKIVKNTQGIKNAQANGDKLKLEDLFEMSEEYGNFVNNREGVILSRASEMTFKIDNKNYNASDLIGKIEMKKNKDGSPKMHPHEELAILPFKTIDNAELFDPTKPIGQRKIYQRDPETGEHRLNSKGEKIPKKGLKLSTLFKNDTLESQMAHSVAYNTLFNEETFLKRVQEVLGVDLKQMTEEDGQMLAREYEEGANWGAYMRQAMNDEFRNLEESEYGQRNDVIANSMTWDYNKDFVDFVQRWIDGFNVSEGVHQKGFNELTKVQQIAGTLQFLDGIKDATDGITKKTTRKIPPVSNRQGETLLDPGIMREYFKTFNKVSIELKTDTKKYQLPSRNSSYTNTLKEYFNCE